MDYEAILFDVNEGIAVITLNRPERMNTFSDALLSEWADAIVRCQEDDSIRVVVITGAGRAFCAGADLRATGDQDTVLMQEAGPAERRNSLRYSVYRVPHALEQLDKPYIAAINGAAVGAGMDMASMADIRISSDKARFGMSYINVALVPGDGGAWLLPRIVGKQKALDLIWSGEIFGAEEALEMGYLLKVVPHDNLMDEVMDYAQKLAKGPPVAIQLGKQLVRRADSLSFVESLNAAQHAFTISQLTEDAKEGPLAFREKRPPNYTGR
ncbi:MAG: enoyl-CoA hydratase [Chloroflexi bacterium]|nr:enoyl-CoA hydratase [Chloroflexota bacterium]|tara:strand:+ start:3325 stop:4131 length:807 start_codon:yes stop_codon:yes gene_type:complete